MEFYNSKDEKIDLATEEYVNGKSKFVKINDGLGIGKHSIDLNNVKCIILNIQNDGNQTFTIPFISTTFYLDTVQGINVTVNFHSNLLQIDYLPGSFKVRSYLILY